MKHLSILFLALALAACSSTKTAKTTIQEKPFSVDLDSPSILAGMTEAQFNKPVKLVGIKTSKVTVNYYPLEDAVCIQCRPDLMTFYIFLDKDGRDAYLKALKQYKEDYENKTLKTKGSKKTKQQYGNTEIYLVWQAFTYTTRAKANTILDFGYDIKSISKDRAAFFTLYRREVYYYEPNASEQDRRIATNEPMYLTRAQADELASFLDQDYLSALTSDKVKIKTNSTLDTY